MPPPPTHTHTYEKVRRQCTLCMHGLSHIQTASIANLPAFHHHAVYGPRAAGWRVQAFTTLQSPQYLWWLYPAKGLLPHGPYLKQQYTVAPHVTGYRVLPELNSLYRESHTGQRRMRAHMYIQGESKLHIPCCSNTHCAHIQYCMGVIIHDQP